MMRGPSKVRSVLVASGSSRCVQRAQLLATVFCTTSNFLCLPGFGPALLGWALHHSVFRAMVADFCLSPVIDFFTTLLNSQLLVLLSSFPDLAAFSVNALSVL